MRRNVEVTDEVSIAKIQLFWTKQKIECGHRWLYSLKLLEEGKYDFKI